MQLLRANRHVRRDKRKEVCVTMLTASTGQISSTYRGSNLVIAAEVLRAIGRALNGIDQKPYPTYLDTDEEIGSQNFRVWSGREPGGFAIWFEVADTKALRTVKMCLRGYGLSHRRIKGEQGRYRIRLW